MNLTTILFFSFLGLTTLAAVAIFFARNVFHAALFLIVCLLSIAGIYVLLNAEFLAVTQIMIYAGGVLVLIIFGVMLSSRLAGTPLKVESSRTQVGILLGVVLFGLFVYAIENSPIASKSISPVVGSAQTVGYRLITDHVAPFEVVGLLLLISLIGAAVTASTLKK